MSDTESMDYLQTGFDPNTLTIPRLRSILVQHDIQYSASAKKPQLVELFTENILPQSRKLLAARSRAKRTSKGITDAESSQGATVNAEVDAELMPPPPTPRVRTKKSSTKVKQEESESDTPARSPTKKTPRASKHARASDNETGPDGETVKKTVRKVRKSESPAIKAEEEEPSLHLPRVHVAESSPFSDDNPFQSGSSPLAAMRSTSGETRRQTLGATAKDPSRRKSPSTTRRRTDVPRANDGITPPSSKTFDISVRDFNKMTSADNGVEAGEEFTPEEQSELVRERSQNGQSAIVPRRSAKKQSKGMSSAGPIWVVLLTLFGGYATWYRQEKLAVGYCGVGREPHQIVSEKVPQLPEWAVAIAEPQCEPCPQHAYCYEQLKTKCEPDFVLKHHPLSVGGLIPLPPTCEPDGEKVRRIKVVADRAVEELRERRAKFECGELVDDEGVPLPSVEIDANDLKKEVSKKRRKGMSETEFEDLWAGALGEIEGREEVESSSDGNTSSPNTTRLSSTSLARLPFTCAIRRSVRLTLARHRLQLVVLTILAGVILYARQQYWERIATNAAVPHLVSLTLDRLATQAALHVQDKEAFPEPWISVSQLRDDVLRDEHSVSKREKLWSRVKAVVEMNANVRASSRESRNGEISRVWEWIGAVGAIEDGLSERRRKSGRVSWGVYGNESSPVSGTDDGPEIVQQKWMEGRPIY